MASEIKSIYEGGYSSLSPKYGDMFTGYRLNPSSLGMTTDPRNANVLQDISTKLNVGARHIEMSAVSPEVFESIPNQQLKEVHRLSKLTGIDVSVHGPIVEPSGMTQQGFSESNRVAAERQIFSAVERSNIINPNGNVPVTFHSSAVPFPTNVPPKGKPLDETMIINADSGSIHKIPLKERFFPGEEGKKDVKKEIAKINEEQWMENLRQLEHHAEVGQEAVDRSIKTAILSEAEKRAGKTITEDENAMRHLYNRGSAYLNSAYNSMQQLFDVAYNKVPEADKHKIQAFFKEVDSKAREIQNDKTSATSIQTRKEIIEKGLELLKDVTPPEQYKDLNEFAKEKTVETFSNVALNTYKKFKDKSPIISVENPPAGVIFSTGQELKEIIEESRNKFVEKAVKEGISEREARNAANKILGVTWDVGHINMLRKQGFESGDIVKETEKIAPLVKHVHLSDNFGFEHTELPMGMGNVPIKDIMEKLGKEGFDARKIIEAGNWWQHFKTPPFRETLEAFGSPIYAMQMGPYWNQNAGFQQNYFGGYGQMLPQTNYETFGAGFSRLPSELGGQRPGAEGSRMSGRPME